MGLVLDSSVLIVAEREAKPVSSLLAEVQQRLGENEIVLSSITVVELEHGLHRAQTAEQAQKRRGYLEAIFAAIPVESFSREMAQIAAKVDADARRVGKVIPFADLLIGATAVHYSYAVATRNTRHFRMIPNLTVLSV
jgi:tRNA(fMet)-specific endonuclease VapC